MIRVLQIVGELNPTGIDNLVMSLYREIIDFGIQFDFVVHGNSTGFYEEEVLALGGRVYHITKKTDNFFKSQRELSSILRTNSYDIVHAHQDSMSGLSLKVAKKEMVNCRIAHAHTTNLPKGVRKWIYHFARRLIKKNSTIRLACSKNAGDWLFTFSNKTQNYILFKNCIDVKKFVFSDQNREILREKLQLNGKKILIHVGRFAYAKNHEFLIEVFKALSIIDPDYMLVLVGTGELIQKVKQKVEMYNLTDRVLFLGERNDITDLLSMADIFLMPSYFEGFPVSLIEAQTSGIHIIASENIDNSAFYSKNYELLPITNKNKWVDAIMNSSIYERKNGVEISKKNGFDCREQASNLAKLYRNNIL